MKKTTLNRVLTGIIAMLICSICFLILCITSRPRYVSPSEPENSAIVEVAESEPSTEQPTDIPEIITVTETIPSPDIMQGKTSSKVNIRDAASDQARVLETVEEGYMFEIVEILDNGWTKLVYEGQDAYISSSYVIIVNP